MYVADPDTLRRVTGYSVHRGALAAMSRLPLPPPLELARTARTLAVLEDLVDHTNVGAVFRSAAGPGRRRGPGQPAVRRPALPAVGEGVDGGRLLGAVVTPRGLAGRAVGRTGARGISLLALTPAADATPIGDLPPDVTERCALLVGAEGPGLSQAALDAADHRVRIPMSGGVDSLNAAAASAVAFYALSQGRGQSRR